MGMSKKHFIQLADALRPVKEQIPDEVLWTIARFCQRQNSRFMSGRWFGYLHGTCGPSGGKVKQRRLNP